MAVQLINIGDFANDGTGDDLREAFAKVNANFEMLDLRNDEQTTASNLGTGSSIFKERVGYDLQFKKLKASASGRITLEETISDEIEFDAVGGEMRFVTNSGTHLVEDSLASNIIHMKGVPYPVEIDPAQSDQVYTSYEDGEIKFRINPKLKADNTPTLGGNLNANFNDIINGGTVTATEFNGPINGLVFGIDIRTSAAFQQEGVMDFGGITETVTNMFDWIVSGSDIDFGSFTYPDYRTFDAGTII